MKKLLIMSLLISSVTQAQFTFKGTITNYPNKRVVVKISRAFDDLVIGNVTTDTSGTFSVSVKEKYIGVIEVALLDAQRSFIFISDNTNINFTSSIDPDGNFTLNNPGNSINKVYQDYQDYDMKKNLVLPRLQSIADIYHPEENFYTPLKNEIQAIEGLKEPDTSKYPFLSYYISTSELIKNSERNNDPASTRNRIIEHFKNAGEEFETSGIEENILHSYLRLSYAGASNQTEWENKIDSAIESLLDEVGEDTRRGQDILSAAINFLNGYGITGLSNKYLNRAEAATCDISPELKETIAKNNTIKEGKIIPNIKFTHKLKEKYSSLYDIKTKYKLIIVWASWCNHCQQEMPFVKQFYENFKGSGGEIIGLSIDYDKKAWEDFVKGTSWLNDSDLLYWDSKYIKELNITGTPTLILLDQNNKILKISAKISDINSVIN
ncbi:MAG: TlpA family protein disulfide reductase [Flavobacteriaceae bacterium]|jgi:thiol-disulfide isomerase/thioredoxin|nr:TlpA family protein disulfide reductase [Flavobacteriaceae bacterium]